MNHVRYDVTVVFHGQTYLAWLLYGWFPIRKCCLANFVCLAKLGREPARSNMHCMTILAGNLISLVLICELDSSMSIMMQSAILYFFHTHPTYPNPVLKGK